MTYIEEYYKWIEKNPNKVCKKVKTIYQRLVMDLKKPKTVSFFNKATGENEYKATFDSQEMIDALTYISDLKWKHNIFLDNSLISMDEQFKQLAIGNVGMIIAAADYPNYVSKYEMPLENIGMLAIPAGPARRVTLSGGYTATIA